MTKKELKQIIAHFGTDKVRIYNDITGENDYDDNFKKIFTPHTDSCTWSKWILSIEYKRDTFVTIELDNYMNELSGNSVKTFNAGIGKGSKNTKGFDNLCYDIISGEFQEKQEFKSLTGKLKRYITKLEKIDSFEADMLITLVTDAVQTSYINFDKDAAYKLLDSCKKAVK